MRLAVIGTGYVGLVAGAGFADFGNDVVCADLDQVRIARLRRGELPLHEPGLDELIHRNARENRLAFTGDPAEAARRADIVLLAVGTPPGPDGSADVSQVLEAAATAARAMPEGAALCTKSTVPVGTAERLRGVLEAIVGRPVAVLSNPEFLKEGSAVEDFLRPARVIVGVGQAGVPLNEPEARALIRMRHLYEPVLRTSDRLLVTDARSAELTKYASNAYLATRVSFINDIAQLCEQAGADVEAVRRGMGMDPRIGDKFLFPGIGFGGSCFPKDVRALLHTARSLGLELHIVQAALKVNERQRTAMLGKLTRHLGTLVGKVICVWGLSFKPETDDVREAPALHMIEWLLHMGATVRATDPAALASAARALGEHRHLSLHEDPYEAAGGADALLLCTEWRPYRQPDLRRLKTTMRGDGIFDGRNALDPAEVREAGFSYHGIGRPA